MYMCELKDNSVGLSETPPIWALGWWLDGLIKILLSTCECQYSDPHQANPSYRLRCRTVGICGTELAVQLAVCNSCTVQVDTSQPAY